MSKLLFVGDIHLADRPPSTRRPGYASEILAKLREVGWLARDHKVNAVVLAGDVFHSKVPHRTSHELVQQTIAVFGAYRVPVFCVPGNHDYSGANVATLSRSPLGTLAASGAVTLFGVPGQRSVTITPPPRFLTLHGIREEEPIEEFGRFEFGRVALGDSDVVVAHSAIFPESENPPFPHFKAADVAAHLGIRMVLYGHIHEPHGVYEENGVVFVNPGSLSRGSLWEADPYRIPQVALVDVVQETAEMIPLESALPWDEVFRVTEEHEKRDRSLAAQVFAEELAAASIEVFDVERVIAGIRSREDVSQVVIERAVELVEKVGI